MHHHFLRDIAGHAPPLTYGETVVRLVIEDRPIEREREKFSLFSSGLAKGWGSGVLTTIPSLVDDLVMNMHCRTCECRGRLNSTWDISRSTTS